MIDPAEIHHNLAVEAECCAHPDIEGHEDLDARMADHFDLPRSRAKQMLQWIVVAMDVSGRPEGELRERMFAFL